MMEDEGDPARAAAEQAVRLARVALIVSSIAAALAVLGLFLPISLEA
jgi:hypothetical protein